MRPIEQAAFDGARDYLRETLDRLDRDVRDYGVGPDQGFDEWAELIEDAVGRLVVLGVRVRAQARS